MRADSLYSIDGRSRPTRLRPQRTRPILRDSRNVPHPLDGRAMVPDGVEHGTPRRSVRRRDLFRRRQPSPVDSNAPLNGHYSLINASRPLMGSYFEVRLGTGVPGAIDLATRALDVVEELEARLTVYQRRVGGQPDQRDGPPRPGRGRGRPVRPAPEGAGDRPGHRRGLRRDGRGALDGLGVHPGPEAGARPRGPGRRPGPDRGRSPDPGPRLPGRRLRPAGGRDQPGEHRQGVRDRPGLGRDPGPLVADVGPDPRRAVEPLRPGLAPRRLRRPLAGRPPRPLRPVVPARDDPPPEPGDGHLGLGLSSGSRPAAGPTATSSTPGPASRPSTARPA